MEISVWQLFVQAAEFLSSLFARSSGTPGPENGGASRSAHANDANLTSTSTNATVLGVTRDPSLQTTDAMFGRMTIDGGFVCFTMERTAVSIPEGSYRGYKRDSSHFGRRVVGIDVPSRTDIECHVANYPSELEGCIAVGEKVGNDCLDSSESAFERMMRGLPETFTVVVSHGVAQD